LLAEKKIITSYKLEINTRTGFYSIKAVMVGSPELCPKCRGAVRYRDNIVRKRKSMTGKISCFLLRRLKCQRCGMLHREIPVILHPNKQYDSLTIQSILDGRKEAATCAADDSTIRRWRNAFKGNEPKINQVLASIRGRAIDEKVPLIPAEQIVTRIRTVHKRWLGFVTALLINNGYKSCTGFAFCPEPVAYTLNSTGQKAKKGGSRNDQTTQDSS
jgi:hypothetical protein